MAAATQSCLALTRPMAKRRSRVVLTGPWPWRVAAALAAARVVDVGEEPGQGTHGVGGDHGLRTSVSVGGKQPGAGQARPRVGSQGADERQLGAVRGGAP